MFWNHRVLRHTDGEHEWFAIHEVHYDDEGNAEACTMEPADAFGDTVDGVREALTRMLACLDRPALNYDDIGTGSSASSVAEREALT